MKLFAKKSLCVTLVLCLLMSMVPMIAQADEGGEVRNGLEKIYTLKTVTENDENGKPTNKIVPNYDTVQGEVGIPAEDLDYDNGDKRPSEHIPALTGFGDSGREVIGFNNVDLGTTPVQYVNLRMRARTNNPCVFSVEVWVDAPSTAEGGTKVAVMDKSKQDLYNGFFFNEFLPVVDGLAADKLTGQHNVYIASSKSIQLSYFVFETSARSPYERREAENEVERYGGDMPINDTEVAIGWFGSGDNPQVYRHLCYKNFNFDLGVKEFNLFVSIAGVQPGHEPWGANYRVRIDSLNGPVIAEVTTDPNEGIGSWRSVTVPATAGVSGVHDIYISVNRETSFDYWSTVPLFVEPENDAELGEFVKDGDKLTITADVNQSWLTDPKYDLASLILVAYDANGNMLDMTSRIITMDSEFPMNYALPYGTTKIEGSMNVPENTAKVVAVVVDHLLSGSLMANKTYIVK